ncbi:leucine-rich repeat-containing protein 32 [Alligator mississippiensis]|uniref:Leucine-rich repeat-containing protein 32 n=1 Tax=Alligator mississippiensis TaxID=8496 RepID=A0A151M429_ALLMI|nr:leucine-rich repeat-containing protein 32 [Alligator mississippiensis]
MVHQVGGWACTAAAVGGQALRVLVSWHAAEVLLPQGSPSSVLTGRSVRETEHCKQKWKLLLQPHSRAMKLYILLFLAVVNKGISTYRPSEESPCEMVNMEAICHSKDLHHIPPELHPDVNKIDFSGNQIQNIPLKPLSFYTSLQHLDFNSNQISFIEQGVFAHMTSLVEINLAHNRLDRFIQHRTRGVGLLPNVATLDLSHNSLYNGMTEYFTHEAPSLQYLSLAENSITLISRRTFQGSPALVEVDLHSNIIMEIEEGAFEALLNLSKLNLSMNSITCIADFSLRQLQILDLSRNSIESFHTTESEEEFNLTWLDLSENKLMYFPTFPQVNKLVFLNLSKNLIQLSAESPRDGCKFDTPDLIQTCQISL